MPGKWMAKQGCWEGYVGITFGRVHSQKMKIKKYMW